MLKKHIFSLDELVNEISRMIKPLLKLQDVGIFIFLFGVDGKINDTQVVSLRVLPRKPQGSDYR